MTEKSWDFGQDDEELFELAMHDRQYRDYKSGIAKKRFEDDLQRAKDAALAKQGFSEEEVKRMKRAKAEPVTAMEKGQIIWEIDVESPSMPPEVGHKYGPDDVFCYIATPWHCLLYTSYPVPVGKLLVLLHDVHAVDKVDTTLFRQVHRTLLNGIGRIFQHIKMACKSEIL